MLYLADRHTTSHAASLAQRLVEQCGLVPRAARACNLLHPLHLLLDAL
jgi:hypothetical protein